MRIERRVDVTRLLLLAVVSVSAQVLWSEPPQATKFSAFAPAADLIEQVDAYIEQLGQAVSDRDEFEGAGQSRAWRDANTLAVLALVLSAHDEPHPLKPSLGALLRGAQAMSAAEDNFEAARAALAQIKAAREGHAQGNEAIKWEKVASLGALMKQVPLVHAGLKRNVTPNRLARTARQSAAQAATLAAIAEAAMLDDAYGKSPADAAAWSAFCTEMRDASGEVNSAVHARDQARVDAGMKRMLENCDACHARFRQR
jgi:hypothetical protein